MSESVTISVLGDICPTRDTISSFIASDVDRIVSSEVKDLFSGSDLVVANLECAITDNPKPIRKAGPVLSAPLSILEALKSMGIKALSVANNHIRDCGATGLEDTLAECRRLNLATFGVCSDNSKTNTPLSYEAKGKKIGVISFAEKEFNTATENRPGAAYFNPFTDLDLLADIKSKVDYLIVLYHGGIEHHPYPSPLLQEKCRKMAQCGADMILCQHSHCIGSYEWYGDSFILYGQGNSIFGYRPSSPSWNESLIIQIKLGDGGAEVIIKPCSTYSNGKLFLADEESCRRQLELLKERNLQILDKDFVLKEWRNFCRKQENLNLPLLLGWNRYLIWLNRKTNGLLLKAIYGRRKLNTTNNLIRCESHHEVIRTILDQYNFE